MSLTQFAMVEELAFLVKDNLPCKHLVLSMEEAFINFLQDDPSSDGVLELEPMNAYNRLLLHRLADIFGFSHHSVGEGDGRHLILEHCPETSIPSVLVSDLLWHYDELQPLTTSHQILRRNKASPVSKAETTTVQSSLEEREAAYLAARERIFTRYDSDTNEPTKQKPRSIPVVARRMIAHALGRRINPSNQVVSPRDSTEYGEQTDDMTIQEKEQCNNIHLSMKTHKENPYPRKPKVGNLNDSASLHTEKKVALRPADKTPTKSGISRPRRSEIGVHKDNLKEEHAGAAKRMFAHALGLQPAKDGK
ncbi:hypothetical protein CsSME_00027738 [Camellia sinensis var. sinensis]